MSPKSESPRTTAGVLYQPGTVRLVRREPRRGERIDTRKTFPDNVKRNSTSVTSSPAPSRARRPLTPVPSAGTADGFIQESESSPVLRDNWPDGFDWVCGHCGKVVLAACIADDQLWDLAFQCPGCKGVSVSPELPADMALPKHVLTLPGLNAMAPVDLRGCVMVGRAAIAREQRSYGVQGSTFGRSATRRTPPISDENHLTQIVEDVQRLLGDKFDKLDAKHQQGSAAPSRPNPLMAAIQDTRRAIATFATPTPIVDDRPLMELVTLLDTLQRYKHHPFHPKMVQGLVNEYQHTLIMLAAATALYDRGNGVVFQETGSRRTPDLQLVLGAHGKRASVEVKVPTALATPSGRLGYDVLWKVVKNAVQSAGTGEGGQLSPERPGLLVIGGFHLEPSDANDLVRAATDYLASRKEQDAHIMGIVLVVFVSGFRRHEGRGRGRTGHSHGETSWVPG